MILYDLKTLHMENPVIDQNPEFSWKIMSDKKMYYRNSIRL